jgi:hypothetical protein
MVLLLKTSKCALCGDLLDAEWPPVAVVGFLWNSLDPLWKFSDAAFHPSCVRRSSEVRRALELSQMARSTAQGRQCSVCGDVVIDGFFTEVLTSIPSEPLWHFNLLALHDEHFASWDRAQQFVETLKDARERGIWSGPALITEPTPSWEFAGASRFLRPATKGR